MKCYTILSAFLLAASVDVFGVNALPATGVARRALLVDHALNNDQILNGINLLSDDSTNVVKKSGHRDHPRHHGLKRRDGFKGRGGWNRHGRQDIDIDDSFNDNKLVASTNIGSANSGNAIDLDGWWGRGAHHHHGGFKRDGHFGHHHHGRNRHGRQDIDVDDSFNNNQLVASTNIGSKNSGNAIQRRALLLDNLLNDDQILNGINVLSSDSTNVVKKEDHHDHPHHHGLKKRDGFKGRGGRGRGGRGRHGRQDIDIDDSFNGNQFVASTNIGSKNSGNAIQRRALLADNLLNDDQILNGINILSSDSTNVVKKGDNHDHPHHHGSKSHQGPPTHHVHSQRAGLKKRGEPEERHHGRQDVDIDDSFNENQFVASTNIGSDRSGNAFNFEGKHREHHGKPKEGGHEEHKEQRGHEKPEKPNEGGHKRPEKRGETEKPKKYDHEKPKEYDHEKPKKYDHEKPKEHGREKPKEDGHKRPEKRGETEKPKKYDHEKPKEHGREKPKEHGETEKPKEHGETEKPKQHGHKNRSEVDIDDSFNENQFVASTNIDSDRAGNAFSFEGEGREHLGKLMKRGEPEKRRHGHEDADIDDSFNDNQFVASTNIGSDRSGNAFDFEGRRRAHGHGELKKRGEYEYKHHGHKHHEHEHHVHKHHGHKHHGHKHHEHKHKHGYYKRGEYEYKHHEHKRPEHEHKHHEHKRPEHEHKHHEHKRPEHKHKHPEHKHGYYKRGEYEYKHHEHKHHGHKHHEHEHHVHKHHEHKHKHKHEYYKRDHGYGKYDCLDGKYGHRRHGREDIDIDDSFNRNQEVKSVNIGSNNSGNAIERRGL